MACTLHWSYIDIYDYKAVHLVKDGGEQFQEEMNQLRANQRVPVLEIDGKVLTQSMTILGARVRELCSLIGCDIQPVQNLAVLKGVMALVSESEETATKMEWGKQWITRGLLAVEDLLKDTTSTYCPQVYNAKRFDVNLSLSPRILNISEALQKLPEFQKAHPDVMSDTVLA